MFAVLGATMLADTPGGRDEIRELVDPMIGDLVDQLVVEKEVVAKGSDELPRGGAGRSLHRRART